MKKIYLGFLVIVVIVLVLLSLLSNKKQLPNTVDGGVSDIDVPSATEDSGGFN